MADLFISTGNRFNGGVLHSLVVDVESELFNKYNIDISHYEPGIKVGFVIKYCKSMVFAKLRKVF